MDRGFNSTYVIYLGLFKIKHNDKALETYFEGFHGFVFGCIFRDGQSCGPFFEIPCQGTREIAQWITTLALQTRGLECELSVAVQSDKHSCVSL